MFSSKTSGSFNLGFSNSVENITSSTEKNCKDITEKYSSRNTDLENNSLQENDKRNIKKSKIKPDTLRLWTQVRVFLKIF